MSPSPKPIKAFSIPNHRCTSCMQLLRKHPTFAKSSCRDCSHFPRTFLGFLVLEIWMDLQELKKNYKTVHLELNHHFECIISMEKRLSLLEISTKPSRSQVSSVRDSSLVGGGDLTSPLPSGRDIPCNGI